MTMMRRIKMNRNRRPYLRAFIKPPAVPKDDTVSMWLIFRNVKKWSVHRTKNSKKPNTLKTPHLPQTAAQSQMTSHPSRFWLCSSRSLACLNPQWHSGMKTLERLFPLAHPSPSWTMSTETQVDSSGCCSSAWQNSSRQAAAAQPPWRWRSASEHLSTGER